MQHRAGALLRLEAARALVAAATRAAARRLQPPIGVLNAVACDQSSSASTRFPQACSKLQGTSCSNNGPPPGRIWHMHALSWQLIRKSIDKNVSFDGLQACAHNLFILATAHSV